MTYSIVARDPATGAFAIAAASFSPLVSTVPCVANCVAAGVMQGLYDDASADAWRRIADGVAAGAGGQQAIMTALSNDPKALSRQIAIVDWDGRVSCTTGPACGGVADDMQGDGVAVVGNLLRSRDVLPAMLRTFKNSRGDIAGRVLSALAAGYSKGGGDKRGTRCAVLVIAEPEGRSPLLFEAHGPDSVARLIRTVMEGAA